MAKIVRYNGGTESYYGCSSPSSLIVGKEYEVVSENKRAWQTDYTLNGVQGKFNSCWFDKVNSKQTYFAISCTVPTVGERYSCYRLQFVGGNPIREDFYTDTVKSVIDLDDNIYKVVTYNSNYIVKVV